LTLIMEACRLKMMRIQLVKTLKFLHLFRYTFLSLQVTELNADLCVSKGENPASMQGSITAFNRDAVLGYEDTVVN
jgi:hypothetical protein